MDSRSAKETQQLQPFQEVSAGTFRKKPAPPEKFAPDPQFCKLSCSWALPLPCLTAQLSVAKAGTWGKRKGVQCFSFSLQTNSKSRKILFFSTYATLETKIDTIWGKKSIHNTNSRRPGHLNNLITCYGTNEQSKLSYDDAIMPCKRKQEICFHPRLSKFSRYIGQEVHLKCLNSVLTTTWWYCFYYYIILQVK